jgi:cytochrome c peroxidase
MKRTWSCLLMGFGVFGLTACQDPPKKEAAQPAVQAVTTPVVKKKKSAVMALTAAFKPALTNASLPGTEPATEAQITLGRQLYFDKRLSKNQDISCNSCHLLDKFGVDSKKTSPGHRDQLGTRNSPTVYNAAGHFVQFWDGRSPHVEHQATQPVTNPVEMAMPDEKAIVKVLSSIPEYVQSFAQAFPGVAGPVTLENAGKAMGAFERGLVTPGRWDKFLGGDAEALTEAEQQGFKAFMDAGCNACHTGTLVGGTMYQKLGVTKSWPNQVDQGRFDVTKQESDKMMFKVPSLRNIAETAPYFHDGSVATLEEAVTMMAEYELTQPVAASEVAKIVTWLKSLTGEVPTAYIKEPVLPASTAQTPKPNPK